MVSELLASTSRLEARSNFLMAEDEWTRQFYKQLGKIHQTLANLEKDSRAWSLGKGIICMDEWDANGRHQHHRQYKDCRDGINWNESRNWNHDSRRHGRVDSNLSSMYNVNPHQYRKGHECHPHPLDSVIGLK